MPTFTEVRPFLAIDVPLLARLASSGVILDSAARLTRGVNALEGAMLCAVPLADLGTPTFVARHDETAYVGQMRHKHGDNHAQIVFIAPELERGSGAEVSGADEWLHLISAMCGMAARRGALTLKAEAEDGSLTAEVLGRAGFGVFARQEIWRRSPAPIAPDTTTLWRPAHELDALSVTALYASVMPRLVMQADNPPEVRHGGLVYERKGKIYGYLTIQEGKFGIFIQPYIHPDVASSEADELIAGAVASIARTDKLPVYVCVRRYQSWLRGALDKASFEVWNAEVLMVKHTVARIERPVFRPAFAIDGAVVAGQSPGQRIRRIGRIEAQYKLNGISYHRRFGKVEGSPARLSGRRA